MALLSTAQLGALQIWARQGMTTPIAIFRRTLSDNVYGDAETITWVSKGIVNGWLYSRPTPVATEDTGALVTVNTYRLVLPVGTDIIPGDQVTVGTETYIVSDTTAESTWQALLTCSLRKRE